MKTSESITNISVALLKAQKAMGGAKKGASNPYFKSKYADLGAVLEACKEILNENGIVILQPHSRDVVETILVHESGEWISSETMIVCSKQNDPQAYGSAVTYARRYGLQSLVSMPAEDDDGEGAMARTSKPTAKTETVVKTAAQATKTTVATPNAQANAAKAVETNGTAKTQTASTTKASSFKKQTVENAESQGTADSLGW